MDNEPGFDKLWDFFKYIAGVDLAAVVGFAALSETLGLDPFAAAVMSAFLLASLLASICGLATMTVREILSEKGTQIGYVEWLCFFFAVCGLVSIVIILIPTLIL